MSIGSAKDLPCNAAMEAPDLNYPRPLPSWLAESSEKSCDRGTTRVSRSLTASTAARTPRSALGTRWACARRTPIASPAASARPREASFPHNKLPRTDITGRSMDFVGSAALSAA